MKKLITVCITAAAALGGLATATACNLQLPGLETPPLDTPKQTSTFTLGDLWPDAPESTVVPVSVPFNLSPYKVKESEGGIPIDVPADAQKLPVSSGILHLTLASQMKINLGFKFYLAKDKPYATAPIAETTIGPGETKQIDTAFDVSLLKQPRVFAGVEAQVRQSPAAVVKKSDPLTATVWATIRVKLL